MTKVDSDLEHIQVLIRAKGYKLPAGMMTVRLVHLLDEQKRKELMIIYGEDVRPPDSPQPNCFQGKHTTDGQRLKMDLSRERKRGSV